MASSLIAFRKRIWNGLFEDHPIPQTNGESSRGTKRKSSLDPNLELELKRLRLNTTKVKQEYNEDEDVIMGNASDEDTIVVKTERRSTPKRIKKQQNLEFRNGDESEEEEKITIKKENIWDKFMVERLEHVTNQNEGYEEWSKAELEFVNVLNDRGAVPMLWSYWKIDFPTLPHSLFTSEKGLAVIKNWKGNALAGARALNALIQAGPPARERIPRGQNAAQLLAKAINAYIKWSFRDAKLEKDDYDPLIVVVHSTHKNSNPESTITRAEDQVRRIGDLYKALWRNSNFICAPPTIFYIVICGVFMSFGSYDTSAEYSEFRVMFDTDWKSRGKDLWNAMAVAVLVEQTRRWLAEVDPVKASGRKKSEIDPDL